MLDSGFIFENPRRHVAVLDVGKSIIGNWKLKPETGNFSSNRFTDNRITTLITMLVSADCYLLCIMMALDTEIMFFFNLNGWHKFLFYTNLAYMLAALCSYALICCIIQENICMIDTVFGIKVRLSGLCINRYQPIIGRLLDADYRPADNRP